MGDAKQYLWRKLPRHEQLRHVGYFEDKSADSAVLRGLTLPTQYRYWNGASPSQPSAPTAPVAAADDGHGLRFLKAKKKDAAAPAAGPRTAASRRAQRHARYWHRRHAAVEHDRLCVRERYAGVEGGTAPEDAALARVDALMQAVKPPAAPAVRGAKRRRFDDAAPSSFLLDQARKRRKVGGGEAAAAPATPPPLGGSDVMWFEKAPSGGDGGAPTFKLNLYGESDEDSSDDAAEPCAGSPEGRPPAPVRSVKESWDDYVLRVQADMMRRTRQEGSSPATWLEFAALQERLHAATPYSGTPRPAQLSGAARRALFDRQLAILDEGLARCGDDTSLWDALAAAADAFLPTALVEDVWEEYLRRCPGSGRAWCAFLAWRQRDYAAYRVPALRQVLGKALRKMTAARLYALTQAVDAGEEGAAGDAREEKAGKAEEAPPRKGQAEEAPSPPRPPQAYPPPHGAPAYPAYPGYPAYPPHGFHGGAPPPPGWGPHAHAHHYPPQYPPPPYPPHYPPAYPPHDPRYHHHHHHHHAHHHHYMHHPMHYPPWGGYGHPPPPPAAPPLPPGPAPEQRTASPEKAPLREAEGEEEKEEEGVGAEDGIDAAAAVFRVEEGAVRVAAEAARVEWCAGYPERAVALYQALLEVNLFPPPAAADDAWDGRLAAFAAFWEGEAARVGEAGAVTWRRATPDAKPPPLLPASEAPRRVQMDGNAGGSSDSDVDVEELVGAVHARGVYAAWAAAEGAAREREWEPCRAVRDRAAAARDPDRVVLYDDVAAYLVPVYDPRNRKLVVALFLEQLGFPILYLTHPWEHPLILAARERGSGAPAVLTSAFAEHPPPAGGDVGDEGGGFAAAPGAPADYLRILRWAPRAIDAELTAPADKQRRVEFIERVIRACTGDAEGGEEGGVFAPAEADRLVLELYAGVGDAAAALAKGKELLGTTRHRTGAAPGSLPLWTRYAEVAAAAGKHALRNKVYATLLAACAAGGAAGSAPPLGPLLRARTDRLHAACSYVESMVGSAAAGAQVPGKGFYPAAGGGTEAGLLKELAAGIAAAGAVWDGRGRACSAVAIEWDEGPGAGAACATRTAYRRAVQLAYNAAAGVDNADDADACGEGLYWESAAAAARAGAWWELLSARSPACGVRALQAALRPLEALLLQRRQTDAVEASYAAGVALEGAVEALWRATVAVAALPAQHPQRVFRYRPSDVLEVARAAAARFPSHPVFSAVHAEAERRLGRQHSLRVALAKRAREQGGRRPLAAALRAHIEAALLGDIGRAEAVLRGAVEEGGGAGSELLWGMWMGVAASMLSGTKERDDVDAMQEALDAALASGEKVNVRRKRQKELDAHRRAVDAVKGVFYRAVAEVPGSVRLWTEGLRRLGPALSPRELQDAVDVMHEKELHVRVFVEELV